MNPSLAKDYTFEIW
jgi:hypothetical protein